MIISRLCIYFIVTTYSSGLFRWFFESLDIGSFNLQRYHASQHFKKIHTERAGLSSLHRVFAFMTYLNDVDEGDLRYLAIMGEIQPQKGLTLLWPAEWTLLTVVIL